MKNDTSSYLISGAKVTVHYFEVPLDHSGRDAGTITICVREMTVVNKKYAAPLLYLNGGPGMECTKPNDYLAWMKCALNYHSKLFLMDQRGTGNSCPITTDNLSKQGSPQQQADYLCHFRADSIVKDAEIIRKRLLQGNDEWGGRWSLLGQSFGGFCILTYLSLHPEGIFEAYVTGGIPPCIDNVCCAEQLYRVLFLRVRAQNQKYYARFPGDVERIGNIIKYLAAQPNGGLQLRDGTLLTPRLFQVLGMTGLGGLGGFEVLHHLVEQAFDQYGNLTPTFIKSVTYYIPFDSNPLYALLHEAIYCQGGVASAWAAERVRQAEFRAEFDALSAAQEGRPVLFTGEMIFPWMFEDLAGLRSIREAAECVAQSTSWSKLYDINMLNNTKVPVAAVIYHDDMFVECKFSLETIQHIQGAKQWVTNEFMHSGLRDDGFRILDRLIALNRDYVPNF
eukprot:TRINITY_DN8643_c0_g2_i2.p1 TRINITY_DN8643_c0_g2~~TRINITY_DN8643_c0_g2_i2.p1  ORF type:complete len:515 (-),score=37.97 TRINITY_DN8643_c0_g2_i2:369-1718(-)